MPSIDDGFGLVEPKSLRSGPLESGRTSARVAQNWRTLDVLARPFTQPAETSICSANITNTADGEGVAQGGNYSTNEVDVPVRVGPQGGPGDPSRNSRE
jgi:hypothetical protein